MSDQGPPPSSTPSPAGAARWRVVITTVDGRLLRWRKGGKTHTLSPELGPVWIANFRPAVFQVAADGALVPRGTAAAVDIVGVALEPDA